MPRPVEGDVQRVAVWVQALTGLRLDEEGVIHTLADDAWQNCRNELEQLGGGPEPR
jgi:hypothetical protein